MNLRPILDPGTEPGAVLAAVLGGLIVQTINSLEIAVPQILRLLGRG